MSDRRIRIAIIGGGLAGASVANALIRNPRLDIHLFEAAPEFSERGASIGLSCNAQRALREFIPEGMDLLDAAGAVSMQSSRVMIASGPQAGTFVCDVGNQPVQSVIVHRGSFLEKLLAPLPPQALHVSKQLASIVSSSDGETITFEDDSVDVFDAAIGADGVFSKVRQHLLPSSEAAGPSGFWDCRNLISYERAKRLLGDEYFDLDRQYGWVGEGAYFLHDVLENKTMVQCIMSCIEKESPPDRIHKLTRPLLQETLQTWGHSPIADKMIDILLDQPNPEAYSAWEHRTTSTYAKGRICLVGDAAHAMTPWQGSGGGQAIEDAMVMGALFAEIVSPTDIPAGFQAFDAVRRPRCQKIVDSSRETGHILCGADPRVRVDDVEIRDALKHRWDFIHDLDMKAHQAAAVQKMRELQAS